MIMNILYQKIIHTEDLIYLNHLVTKNKIVLCLGGMQQEKKVMDI